MGTPIRVLTLNTWGLWLVSRDREARMLHLAQYLQAAKDLDVVVLQEVWVDRDAHLLMAAGQQGCLVHTMHFRSGTFGSGLVTLSRYPIVAAGFQRYHAAGDALAVHCGDFFASKGVGWVRLATPHGCIDVYNTHLHANYSHKVLSQDLRLSSSSSSSAPSSSSSSSSAPAPSSAAATGAAAGAAAAVHSGVGSVSGPQAGSGARSGDQGQRLVKVPQDVFAAYRISHILELAQLVQCVSGSGSSSGFILAGDLNTKPHFLEMALLRCLLPELTDSWVHVHGASEAGQAAGHTCRAAECTYRSTRQVPERIDYVLSAGFTPCSAKVVLQVTPEGFSYSDHLAVQVELQPTTAHDTSSGPSGHPAPRSPPTQPSPLPPGSPLLHAVSTGRYPWALLPSQPPHSSNTPAQKAKAAGSAAGKGKAGAAGQQAQLDGEVVKAVEVVEVLSQVVGCSVLVLKKGIATDLRHARERVFWAAMCILAALALVAATTLGPALLPQQHRHTAGQVGNRGQQTAGPMPPLLWAVLGQPALAVLAAGVLAAVGMLLGLAGGVADHTQARALQQSLAQLQLLAGHTEQHLAACRKALNKQAAVT